MTETLLSDNASALLISYSYYFVLTAHVSLFVDMSPLQKYPVSRLNHFIVSALSALVPLVVTNSISFTSTLSETLIGMIVAVITSIALVLVIQRVIRID